MRAVGCATVNGGAKAAHVDMTGSGELVQVTTAVAGKVTAENTSLTSLDISSTNAGTMVINQGGDALLEPFCTAPALRTLILRDNGLALVGGRKLFKSLHEGGANGAYFKITTLCVQSNGLGNMGDGLSSLMQVLHT